jgi:hypothetical protein
MFDDLKQYFNNRVSMAKLDIVDSVSNIIGSGVYSILVGAFVLVILFTGSLAAGFLIGNLFDDIGLGFLSVMGFYIILLIVFISFRKKITLTITDKAVEAAMDAMDNSDDDEDEE